MPFQRQYPQTMLRVMMRKSAALHAVEERQGFAATAKDIQNRKGSLQAVSYLLDKVGV
jgi:hypothetical protein